MSTAQLGEVGKNLVEIVSGTNGLELLGLFAIIGCHILKARNDWVFNKDWMGETQIIGNAMSELTEYGLATEKGERNREESQRAKIPKWQNFRLQVHSKSMCMELLMLACRGRGGVGLVLRDEMGQLQKIVTIPITNTVSAELVEALGFRWAASYARDGWGDDLILKGDAQGIIRMLQGVQCAKSHLAVIIDHIYAKSH